MGISYHCDVCGTEVARNAFCRTHPRATIHRVKHHAINAICLLWHEELGAKWRASAERAIAKENAPSFAPEVLTALWQQGYVNLTIEESNDLLEWAASLPGWEASSEEHEAPVTAHQRADICVYCGAEDLSPHEESARLSEPDWERLALEHSSGCQWVATRGMKRDLSQN